MKRLRVVNFEGIILENIQKEDFGLEICYILRPFSSLAPSKLKKRLGYIYIEKSLDTALFCTSFEADVTK